MSHSTYWGDGWETSDAVFLRSMVLNQCLLSNEEISMRGYFSKWQIELSFSLERFWFCLTGLKKRMFFGVYGREQWDYMGVFVRYHLLVDAVVEQNGYQADVFIVYENDTKQMAVVFSPGPSPQCSPEELARQINDLGQQVYEEELFQGDTRFCNVTALSQELHGYTGIREGYLQARRLNDLSYFHMEPEVITEAWLSQRRNDVDYQNIIELCQYFSHSLDAGDPAACQRVLENLLLDRLKHSYSWSLLQGILSHLKYLLNIRYVVWDLELPDLERLCAIESHLRIEDCMEALWAAVEPVCAAAREAPSCQELTLRALYYIRRHFSDNLSIADVAAYVNVTPNYLSDVFQRELGRSVRECITAQRLKAAKALLLQELRVSDVAEAVGFFDVQYFTRLFKKNVGTTPGEYRKKVRAGGGDRISPT